MNTLPKMKLTARMSTGGKTPSMRPPSDADRRRLNRIRQIHALLRAHSRKAAKCRLLAFRATQRSEHDKQTRLALRSEERARRCLDQIEHLDDSDPDDDEDAADEDAAA
jgi:hypothetical protein